MTELIHASSHPKVGATNSHYCFLLECTQKYREDQHLFFTGKTKGKRQSKFPSCFGKNQNIKTKPLPSLAVTTIKTRIIFKTTVLCIIWHTVTDQLKYDMSGISVN